MGLMQRVLSETGSAGGDGLLRRALDLRFAASQSDEPAVAIPEESSTAEKKKPLNLSSKIAA